MSKLHKLYTDLINNPFAAKNYRELFKHYNSIGKKNDAEAFLYVIDNSFVNEEQRGNDSTMSGINSTPEQ